MKLLFTADLHIRLGQKNVPKEWQANRFDLFFQALVDTFVDRECELLVIGGDVFDRLPNMEELELYFKLLERLGNNRVDTVIIPGNHEAVKKNTSFLTNLAGATFAASSGFASIVSSPETYQGIDFLPYNCLKDFEADPGKYFFDPSKILVTHVRGAIEPHVKPEVPLELFERWPLVLAGDLHSYSNSQRNILYPGSPLTTTFHRNETETGVLLVDTETLTHTHIKWNMPQLIRRTVSDVKDMVKTDFHHTIYELEGDAVAMGKVGSHELLDKKLVRKEAQSTLQLHANMTIRETLVVYLKEVMKLDEVRIAQVLNSYDANIKEAELE